MGRTAIVYFSLGGNTAGCAAVLHSFIESDLFSLTPLLPYPKSYGRLLKETRKEAEEKKVIDLAPMDFKPDQYARVLLGTPNWWGGLSTPVRSFIRQYDFGSKEIALFATHGGSGIKSVEEETISLLPLTSRFLGTLSIFDDGEGRLEKRCQEWLEKLEKEKDKYEKNTNNRIYGGSNINAAAL